LLQDEKRGKHRRRQMKEEHREQRTSIKETATKPNPPPMERSSVTTHKPRSSSWPFITFSAKGVLDGVPEEPIPVPRGLVS
jgi:hypothetical protein